MRRIAGFAAWITIAAFLIAGRVQAEGEAKPGSCELGRLEWLAGSWASTEDGMHMEEIWTRPRGGTMIGLHRDVASDKTVSFEFLRIEQAAGGGLAYLAQPGGRPAVAFTCTEIGDSRVVFANPKHDFPQRILYWRTPDGALHARVEGSVKGKIESQEWTWLRVVK